MKRKKISPDKPIKVVCGKNCTLFERWGGKSEKKKHGRFEFQDNILFGARSK